jgi:hypothetical protein
MDKNERYTPLWLLPLILELFDGVIDTDPAAEPTNRMGDKNFYTIQNETFNHGWWCNVWLNPPYNPSGELIKWTMELLRQFESCEHIDQALYLVPAKTETRYFRLLEKYPVLFFNKRLKFDMPAEQNKPQQGAMFPSALFYLGPNVDKFDQVFGEYGRVYVRYEQQGRS